jgi:hypothetical protein
MSKLREKIAEPIDNLMANLTILLLGGDKARVESLKDWSEAKIEANYHNRETAINSILNLFLSEVDKLDLVELSKVSRKNVPNVSREWIVLQQLNHTKEQLKERIGD